MRDPMKYFDSEDSTDEYINCQVGEFVIVNRSNCSRKTLKEELSSFMECHVMSSSKQVLTFRRIVVLPS